jgi:hypothetical protein
MAPIEAKFVDAEFATHYTVEAQDLDSKPIRYRWSLELELVDPAGAKNPGVADSAAAIDLACDNHKKFTGTGDEFVYRHGDPPRDNCNHATMGPKGHQASVIVVVTDGKWECVAEYAGTNDGRGKAAKCRKEDALAPGKLRSAISKLQESLRAERAALEDLKASPPRLRPAYDKINDGRLKYYAAEDLAREGGAYAYKDVKQTAAWHDLEILWNINIDNSPYLKKQELDVPGDIKRLEAAIADKEREIARIQRELRTKH